MKSLLITVFLILSIVFVKSQFTPLPWVQNKFDQTCSNNQISTWFFDNYKCEHCNPNCLDCISYRGCTDCISTYNKTTSVGADDKFTSYCLPCNSQINGPNQGIQSCCFFDNGDAHQIIWSDDFDWVHGITCQPGYKQFGHYCYKIPNCQNYTKYGRCFTCMDGFYLNEEYTCSPCIFPSWYDKTQSPILNMKNPTDVVTLSKYVTEQYSSSQQSFYPDSDTVHNNLNGCKQCNGFGQCTSCNDGFWMGTNSNRTTYDLDISESASFCKKCNMNCKCGIDTSVGTFNACISCIAVQDTDGSAYYFDPKPRVCSKCNIDHVGCKSCNVYYTDLTNERVFNCSDCLPGFVKLPLYDSNNLLQGYACIPCRYGQLFNFQQSGSYPIATGLNYSKFYGNNTNFNQFPNPPQTIPTLTFDYTTANSYGISFQFSNSGLLNQANSFQKYLNSFATDPNCQSCTLKSYVPFVQDPNNSTNTIQQNRNTLFYTTCDICDNGYERQLINYRLSLVYYNYSTSFVANQTTWNQNVNETNLPIYQCETCPNLIKYQYKQIFLNQNITSFDLDNQVVGWKYARRCRFLNQQNQTIQYKITQCGNYVSGQQSNLYPNNFWQDLSDKQSSLNNNSESQLRGPNYNYQGNNFNHTSVVLNTITHLISIIAQGLDTYCVPNINQCREIEQNANYSYTNYTQNGFCSSCYEYTGLSIGALSNTTNNQKQSMIYPSTTDYLKYFLTPEKQCIICDNPICVSCAIYATNMTNWSPNKLRCLQCLNNQEPNLWPILNEPNMTTRINYATDPSRSVFYKTNVDVGPCTSCNYACKSCSLVNNTAICQACQNGFRISNDTNPTCIRCQTKNCKDCTGNETDGFCNVCFPGYRRIIFGNSTTNPNISYYCESCDSYCLTCDANRKECTQCMPGYYLQNNVCQRRRQGCVIYDQFGVCSVCSHSYRLVNGWCLKCFTPFSGQSECPVACSMTNYTDTNTGRKLMALSESSLDYTEGEKILDLLESEKPTNDLPAQSPLLKYSGILLLIFFILFM